MHAQRVSSSLDALQRLRLASPLLVEVPRLRAALGGGVALLTAAMILGFNRCAGCLLYQYDDAYITYRYARNLATGHGLVFNPGDATDSASSFLYTLVLALCHLLGLHDLRLPGLRIGIAGAAATAAVVALACLERTRRPALSGFLGLAVGCHGLVSGWAVSGMETTLFSALVIWALYRLCVLRAYGWLEAALVVAVALTRPEGLLLTAAWLALGLARYAAAVPRARLRLLAQLGCVSGALGLFVLVKWLSYGSLLPHAFLLKRITALYAPRPQALVDVWRSLALGMSLAAAIGMWTLPRRLESWVLLAYVGLSVTSVLLGPYADWARYSVHLLPVAAVLASVPLSLCWRELPALGLAACALVAQESYTALTQVHKSMELGRGHAACRERYLEQHVPPATWVVSSDLGAIAYAAPSLQFIDAVGLTSKDVLLARASGESAEPILFAKQPRLLADTCAWDCTQPQSFSAYKWQTQEPFWMTQLPEHASYLDRLRDGRSLERCQSPDGLWFGAAEFRPGEP